LHASVRNLIQTGEISVTLQAKSVVDRIYSTVEA
jgi:hypothetical protein